MSSPMYGFYALHRDKPQIEHNVAVNVSDVFVARYVKAMDADPLLARSQETGHAVYNLDQMSDAEWAESEIYRTAYSTHTMRHVVEVPITDGGQLLGALHCAASEPERNFTTSDLRLAEAVARILAISITRMRDRHERERAFEHALAALELTRTALVLSEPLAPELRLNLAAQRLLAERSSMAKSASRRCSRADPATAACPAVPRSSCEQVRPPPSTPTRNQFTTGS